MGSMTFELLRKKKLAQSGKNKYTSKKIESAVLLELRELLEEHLNLNDKVMIEIAPRVIGEFLNILNDSIFTVYNYEQVDSNKFVFSNKEITF